MTTFERRLIYKFVNTKFHILLRAHTSARSASEKFMTYKHFIMLFRNIFITALIYFGQRGARQILNHNPKLLKYIKYCYIDNIAIFEKNKSTENLILLRQFWMINCQHSHHANIGILSSTFYSFYAWALFALILIDIYFYLWSITRTTTTITAYIFYDVYY